VNSRTEELGKFAAAWPNAGSGADALQLTLRSSFRARLTAGVQLQDNQRKNNTPSSHKSCYPTGWGVDQKVTKENVTHRSLSCLSGSKTMAVLEPHYSKEEFARRGQTIYERDIRPHLGAGDDGKFVAIDIETGAYELDRDDYTATERLLGRHPHAQIWLLRVGQRTAYRLGGRPGREAV
jgi:hypothetical protein